ncbi:putative ribosomal protein S31 [Chloropicon primus]|uniref:Putative ribosomal protein S31 n=2 Tax=Chloropicon primus TaxID=1764295 RepID=A0A5B8MFR6_9CHLO|nr:putative ribosomal protein S31 [Chloropicon primus]UPQ97392.1 putative ribosomal protein S31 [Chloropicon primus]|eukprot:QDZ18180.1 putative ribosomal protein S31 [Chloropicon primus]
MAVASVTMASMARALAFEKGARVATAVARTTGSFLSNVVNEWSKPWSMTTDADAKDGMLWMGRGDPKTKKGKIFRKSNGKVRPTMKKRRKNKERVAPANAPPLPDEFANTPFQEAAF